MIELRISCTTKSYRPGDRYSRTGEDSAIFPDMTAARAWLHDRYGKCKRAPMYRDMKDAAGAWKTVKTGYIFHFKGADWDRRANGEPFMSHYLQRDWVEFRECKIMELR